MDTLLDRGYLSQYSTDKAGIIIHHNGALTDADEDVTATLTYTATNSVTFVKTADHEDLGTYSVPINSVDTEVPGDYILTWSASINATPLQDIVGIEIGPTAPAYDVLADDIKSIVEQTINRIRDLYDSPYGGPHLTVYLQTHFGRQRMAQLLRLAVGRLNTMAQPFQTYSVEPSDSRPFPTQQWGPILEKVLWIETIKHLRRTYVEQPSTQGLDVARQDRRDYMQRWGEILTEEEAELRPMMDVFKISQMGLGRPGVLVAGGIYGNVAVYPPLSAAARGQFLWRPLFI